MTTNDSLISYLDLRGTPCPLNFIRCRLALDKLLPNQSLKVDIDSGEPEETVIDGLSNAGHLVEIIHKNQNDLTLLINPIES